MKQEIKVGDHVHVGHMVKGGAGARGVVTKIGDDGSIIFKSHEDKRTFRGRMQNATLEKEVAPRNESTEIQEADGRIPVDHLIRSVKRVLGQSGADRFATHLKAGDATHTTWSNANNALTKQGVKPKHIADISVHVKPSRFNEEVELEEQTAEAPSLMKHRIGVSVTDGKTNKRKVKYVIVTHSSNKAGAQKVGEKHFTRKGDFVHRSFHSGIVESTDLEESKKYNPYHAGYDAHSQKKTRQDNPHKEGSEGAAMWAKGWEHASDGKPRAKFTNEEVESVAEGLNDKEALDQERKERNARLDAVLKRMSSPSQREVNRAGHRPATSPDGKRIGTGWKKTNEEVELDEAVEVSHDRYMRSHGEKASGGNGNWMFTHKRSGDVDYKNSSEVHSARGTYSDAKKSAQKWAKEHGHSTVYVMESMEKSMLSFKELLEALKGKQHKLDKNRNGKLDAHDFKLLRKEETELEEGFINGREYASQGVMHPDHAKFHKVGSAMDFYAHGTGDKISGKVTKNDGKEVHIQADKSSGGKTHKFKVTPNLPKPVEEGWDDMLNARKERDAKKGTGKFDTKKYSTGTVYTRKRETFSDEDDAASDKKAEKQAQAATGEAPVKRGRGRPKGSYGSYKARSAETNARAAAKSAASKAANRAKLKEAFDDETIAAMFESFECDMDYIDFEDLLQCEEFDSIDEACMSKIKEKIKSGKSIKEDVSESQLDLMILEALGKEASAGKWISDFIKSDNPRFAGKSKAKRKEMALAAYYAKQRGE